MFQRGTYWIMGTITTVMCIWLVIPEVVGSLFEPGTVHWVEWVGGATPDTLFSEPHRLFTASTAHLGIFHLLVNLALLWIAGLGVAHLQTPWMIPMCFIFSGAVGTAATLLVHGGYALGASAGIFGIFGSLVCLIPAGESSTVWPRRLLVASLVLTLGALGDGELVAHWSGFAAGMALGVVSWSPTHIRRIAWLCVGLWGLSSIVHWGAVAFRT